MRPRLQKETIRHSDFTILVKSGKLQNCYKTAENWFKQKVVTLKRVVESETTTTILYKSETNRGSPQISKISSYVRRIDHR